MMRQQKGSSFKPSTPFEAQRAFLAQVILSAFQEAKKGDADCKSFLNSERCQKWADILGIKHEYLMVRNGNIG